MIRQAAALLGLVVFVLLATANGAGYRYGASDQAAYIPTVILAENPGALTKAQVDSSPEQADRLSVQKRARKTVHQVQIGLSLHRPVFGDGEVVAHIW